MNLLAELRSRFAAALAPLTPEPAKYLGMIRPAQDPKFGDYQANCAMPLKAELNRNPREIADQIVANLDVADLCHPPEVAGPGFINLRLRDEWLAAAVNRLTTDDRLGIEPVANPKTYVVDYSAPNVAKPMHVGHIRSTVIGDALYRILKFLGHRVISDNHIGDWGTQFGMIIYGYKHFLDREAYGRNMVDELARLYRLVNQLSDYYDAVAALPAVREKLARKQSEIDELANAPRDDKNAAKALKKARADAGALQEDIASLEKKRDIVETSPGLKALADAHPNIAVEARRETARLHAGDPENLKLWQTFLPECLAALHAMYDRLGVRFDLEKGESAYDPMLKGVVDDLLKHGIAVESDGAICVFVEGNEAPAIIRKADGAYTYATSDLATIKFRVEELKADVILYVVDARQSEHFRLVFETARQWGYSGADYRHVSFGTILGEDRKPYKTRSGGTIGLESLLDEAVARARAIVNQNDDEKPNGPELDDATRAEIAEVVGIGGIKYADLRHNRDSDYVFSWEKMLAKTGDTATYIQYAYARIAGIFRKGNFDCDQLRCSGGAIRFTAPPERALAIQFVRLHETLTDIVDDYRPNLLTAWLYDTANIFSTFYNECEVLSEADANVRTSRLLLCDLTARTLAQGLNLLGIGTREQM